MIDMRGEEEAALQPHSQVRHERMHNQYNQMKEEDDHWQDVSVSGIRSLTLYLWVFILWDWHLFVCNFVTSLHYFHYFFLTAIVLLPVACYTSSF